MIEKLAIKNFKSIQSQTLELAPLNILMGLNGMGKSSIIQSLLLLRQSFRKYNAFQGGLVLDGEYANIGRGKDALYQYAEVEEISIQPTFSKNQPIDFTFEYKPDANVQKFIKEPSNVLEFLKTLEQYSLFNNNFQYLTAEHIGPKRTYGQNVYLIGNQDIGNKGEFFAHFLDSNRSRKIKFENLAFEHSTYLELNKQIDLWLSEVSPGIKVNTRSIPEAGSILLDFQFKTQSDYTNEYSPLNVGFGVPYVLPVITSILSLDTDKLLILENPESHLHPKGQSAIGKLIGLAAQNNVQIIAETHSDHLLNGIRVAVKKGSLAPERVKIFYFDREIESGDHRIKIQQLKIDKHGRIDDWPDGFIDQWEKDLSELL